MGRRRTPRTSSGLAMGEVAASPSVLWRAIRIGDAAPIVLCGICAEEEVRTVQARRRLQGAAQRAGAIATLRLHCLSSLARVAIC
jgi:hypothetical protein